MKTILIVGVETVVGANFAASWSESARVVGLSNGPTVNILGCERASLEKPSADGIRKLLQQTRATHLVLCGSAARSSWESPATGDDRHSELWATLAAESGLHLTLISSDAVFTGPWMFHDENSSTLCGSQEARAIRELEQRIREANPKTLLVRTNAFGWSPLTSKKGWLESLLAAIENNQPQELDPITHATPILASDLADFLEPALEDELTGLFHVAGAERVSPEGFMRQLANLFELPAPVPRMVRELAARPNGFGRGETSLRTNHFRDEYDCAMPLLAEGLLRLREQQRSGHRDRLTGQSLRPGRAA